MTGNQYTKNKKFPASAMIPGEDITHRPGLLLLQENGDKLYLQSLQRIDRWTVDLKLAIGNHLNLLFGALHKDRFGNVCFADEPHLRPEFRSHFTPIDLFDYYYATWQISGGGTSEESFIRFPDRERFWDFVKTGALLRNIHLTSGSGNPPYKIYPDPASDQITISYKKSKFIFATDLEKGDLYLNEKYYLKNIPAQSYQYNLDGYYPVKDWIKSHDGLPLHREQIHRLAILIAKIEQTAIWQNELEKEKRKNN